MVKDMKMTAMKAVMGAGMRTQMGMGEKENGVLERMTDMASTATPVTRIRIIMVESLKSAMVEMDTRIIVLVEEVRMEMTTIMVREVEALIEGETAPTRMMANILLGTLHVLYIVFSDVFTSEIHYCLPWFQFHFLRSRFEYITSVVQTGV